MTVNLGSSVSAAETITQSALTWMHATPSMPISECVYSIYSTLCPHPLYLYDLTLKTHFDIPLCASSGAWHM